MAKGNPEHPKKKVGESQLISQKTYFMKRAKLVLTAVAVLAIVGGALAFKAKRATEFIYLQKNQAGNCTVTVFSYSTIKNDGVLKVETLLTDGAPGPCVLSTYYTAA
jgi:hypothetical protein